jgi:hypothetical protein
LTSSKLISLPLEKTTPKNNSLASENTRLNDAALAAKSWKAGPPASNSSEFRSNEVVLRDERSSDCEGVAAAKW